MRIEKGIFRDTCQLINHSICCISMRVLLGPRGRSVCGSRVSCRWTEASSVLRCIKPYWPCGTYCWTPAGTSVTSVPSTPSDKMNTSQTHLENRSCPRVQDSNPSVFGRDRQPAAITVEADRQQQCVRRVAVVDGHQDHPDRVPEHRTHLGHIPEEDLGRKDTKSGLFCWVSLP